MNNHFCILVQYSVLVIFLSRNALFSLSLDGKILGKHSMVNFISYFFNFSCQEDLKTSYHWKWFIHKQNELLRDFEINSPTLSLDLHVLNSFLTVPLLYFLSELIAYNYFSCESRTAQWCQICSALTPLQPCQGQVGKVTISRAE